MENEAHILAEEDEIDLRELLLALVAHWVLVGFVAAVFTIMAGYYAFKIAIPRYESQSVFQLPETNSGPSLGGLGGLAGLAGVSLPSGGGFNVFDRVQGRDFIVEIAAELDLQLDAYFNGSLNPPGLKTRVFRAIGLLGKAKPPTDENVVAGIVAVFRANVAASENKNGAFTLITTHIDPEVAARISNSIVRKILLLHRNDQIDKQRDRVEYLSGELAKAQEDLDLALEGVQAFAIANNMLSLQELMQQSQQLVIMRDRRDEIAESIAALEVLEKLLNEENVDVAGLDRLLEDNRQLRQREILLLLGQPAELDSWLALPMKIIETAKADLTLKFTQIDRNLTAFQKEATNTAENAAELARLEREVTIATATHQVMVEQFKALALASGFELSIGTVYETAVPSIGPSQPKKSLILALGLVSGLVIGTGLALILNMRKGSLYSRNAIQGLLGSSPRYFLRRNLPKYMSWQMDCVLENFRASNSSELAELSFALNSSAKPILIVPPSTKAAGSLALLAASQLMDMNTKTVIVDLFAQMPASSDTLSKGSFRVHTFETGLDIAQPETPEMAHPSNMATLIFTEALTTLTNDYGRIILLASPLDQAGYVMRVLGKLDPLVLTTAQPGKITSKKLQRLLSLLPSRWQDNEGLLVLC